MAIPTQNALLYFSENNFEGVMKEISSKGGNLIMRLSKNLLLADLPIGIGDLSLATTNIPDPKDLDDDSKLMLDAWRTFNTSSNEIPSDQIAQLANSSELISNAAGINGMISVGAMVVSGDEPWNLRFSTPEISTALSEIMNGCKALHLASKVATPTKAPLTFNVQPFMPISTGTAALVSPRTNPYGISESPSTIVYGGNLYCFYQGMYFNKKLIYRVYDGKTWGNPTEVEKTSIYIDGPSTIVYKEKICCFYQGSESGELMSNTYDGSNWSGSQKIQNVMISGLPSTLVFQEKIYLFHRGAGNSTELYYNVWDGDKWIGETLVPNSSISNSPSVVMFHDKLYCFYQGATRTTSEGKLFVNVFDGISWSGSLEVPNSAAMTNSPFAVVYDGQLFCFYRSGIYKQYTPSFGNLWFNSTLDGLNWAFGEVNMLRLAASPSLIVFNGALHCLYQGGGQKHDRELWHREFFAGEVTNGLEGIWATSALDNLGYKNFSEFTEALKNEHGTQQAYATCITKFPLDYYAYGRGNRTCTHFSYKYDGGIQGIGESISQLLGSDGKYIQRGQGNVEKPDELSQYLPPSLDAQIYVFYQGADNIGQMWCSVLEAPLFSWTQCQVPITSMTAGPTAIFDETEDNIYLFYQGGYNSGQLMYMSTDGVSWSEEQVVPDTGISQSPSAVIFKGKVYCFHHGPGEDGTIRYNIFDSQTNTWEGDTIVPNAHATAGPAVVVYNDKIYCMHRGPNHSSDLYYNVFDGETWEGDKVVPNTKASAEPSATLFNNTIYCFHQGGSNDAQLWYNTFDGQAWGTDTQIPGIMPEGEGIMANGGIADGPSVIVMNRYIYCFFQELTTSIVNQNESILKYGTLSSRSVWGDTAIVNTISGVYGKPCALGGRS